MIEEERKRLALAEKISDHFKADLADGGEGRIKACMEESKQSSEQQSCLGELFADLIFQRLQHADRPDQEAAELKTAFPGQEDQITHALQQVSSERPSDFSKGFDSTAGDMTIPPASGSSPDTGNPEEAVVGIGEVLGDYEIIDKIGEGGMGQVFKARHRRMKRLVALKTLPTELSDSEELIRRFEREVEAAAILDHPNIVTAYDAGEQDGVHFLVMQYVEGRDVAAVLKDEGPLTPRRALKFVVQAAKGLAYAHSRGVIHRDIKPANLLVDENGSVQILDMGLARIEEEVREGPARTDLTQMGALMGSVDYLAPEQAIDSRNADNRSDIYSLGCSFYQMLTGTPVYTGRTMMEVIMCHNELPIPLLTESVKGLPEEFDLVLQKMLAKNPADRFQKIEDCIVELEKLQKLAENENLEITVDPKAVSSQSLDSLKSQESDSEQLGSIIQDRPRTRWQFKLGLCFVLLLLAISLASMFASYRTGWTSELWLQRYDEMPGTNFEGLGFEIGCLRSVIYLFVAAFVFWRSFNWKVIQIFNPRCNDKGVWVARLMACLIAILFGGYEAYRHLTPSEAPLNLAVESGIENPSAELVSEQRSAYAAFLPYSLVNYMVVVPLLVVIPCATAFHDFPKVRLQGMWFDEKLRSGKLNSKQIITLFHKFESNCQGVCERYLSCLMGLLVAINFECWMGRLTLSESGFSLMAKGWLVCGLAGAACFVWIFSVYIKTNNDCLKVLISSDSADSMRFKNEHNGFAFLKWLLAGTPIGLAFSGLAILLILWRTVG